MKTNDKLNQLRQLMAENNLTAYYINTADPHQSEYIADHFQTRRWLTGFTGSAGYAIVTQDKALLWVDGRYFIQAEQEISDSEFEMVKLGTSGHPTLESWLTNNLKSGDTLGMNGELISEDFYKKTENLLAAKNIKMSANYQLVEEIWNDRPSKPQAPLFIHELKYTGRTAADKIHEVQNKMQKDNVEAALYAGLDDICWLFNIRGNDVQHTPVCLSFALITLNQAFYYVDQNKISDQVRFFLEENNITIKDYEKIYADIENLCDAKITGTNTNSTKLASNENNNHSKETSQTIKSIVLNKAKINHALFSKIPTSIKVINKPDYPYLTKARLNKVELENLKNACLKDSVALTKFIYWLKKTLKSNQHQDLTELNVAEKLFNFRTEQDLFLEESFSTIAAYGANAAMMHYSATEENYAEIKSNGFLLIDSGGQYLDGTTDVTRNITCGELSHEEIYDYTTTLKSHINLAMAIFLHGATGYYLDVLARKPMWDRRMDYKSGTGHAVGYLAGVHEGPQRFNMNYANVPLEEGMVITNEPGIYKESEYGIRLENDYVVTKDRLVGTDQFMKLECLTFVPFDREAVDSTYLDQSEIQWFNTYQKQVFEKISPYLTNEERDWLKNETKPLSLS